MCGIACLLQITVCVRNQCYIIGLVCYVGVLYALFNNQGHVWTGTLLFPLCLTHTEVTGCDAKLAKPNRLLITLIDAVKTSIYLPVEESIIAPSLTLDILIKASIYAVL